MTPPYEWKNLELNEKFQASSVFLQRERERERERERLRERESSLSLQPAEIYMFLLFSSTNSENIQFVDTVCRVVCQVDLV